MLGETRRWDGEDTFIAIRGVSQTDQSLEVKTGALFWLPKTGGVLIDTIMTDLIDHRLFQYSTSMGVMTREDYKSAVRDKRIAECPANVQIIKTEQQSVPEHIARLTRLGVRFQPL